MPRYRTRQQHHYGSNLPPSLRQGATWERPDRSPSHSPPRRRRSSRSPRRRDYSPRPRNRSPIDFGYTAPREGPDYIDAMLDSPRPMRFPARYNDDPLYFPPAKRAKERKTFAVPPPPSFVPPRDPLDLDALLTTSPRPPKPSRGVEGGEEGGAGAVEKGDDGLVEGEVDSLPSVDLLSTPEKRDDRKDPTIPTFPKVHREYLSLDTMRYYDMPWVLDKDDPDYIVITRDVSKTEMDVLFNHTKRVRRGEIKTPGNRPLGHWYATRLFELGASVKDEKEEKDKTPIPMSADGFRALSFANGGELVKGDDEYRPTFNCVMHATYCSDKDDALPEEYSAKVEYIPQTHISAQKALFYFMHIQQEVPDFEKFKDIVLNLPQLRKVRHLIEENLTEDCNRSDAASPKGQRNWTSLNGGCYHYTYGPKVKLTSTNIPFVHVGTHRKRTSLALPNLSAVRHDKTSTSPGKLHTLFQSLNPTGGDGGGDGKQAVCSMAGAEQGKCLHVSQLWALNVNDELLVTCSVLSQEEVYRDLLSSLPSAPNKNERAGEIRLTTPDDRLYVLKQAECLTYLDLASHFSDITKQFVTDFTVHCGEKEIHCFDWAKFMEETTESVLVVELRARSMDSFWSQTPTAASLYTPLRLRKFDKDSSEAGVAESLENILTPAHMLDAVRNNIMTAESPSSENEADAGVKEPASDFICNEEATEVLNLDTADRIYSKSRKLSADDFQRQLHAWYEQQVSAAESNSGSHTKKLTYESVKNLTIGVGFGYDRRTTTEGIMFADIQYGLLGILKLYSPGVDKDAEAAVCGAIFEMITTLHQTVTPAPKPSALVVLMKAVEDRQSLAELFLIASQLDPYSFSFGAMSDHGLDTTNLVREFSRHVAIALSLTSMLAREIDETYPAVEEELARSLAENIRLFSSKISDGIVDFWEDAIQLNKSGVEGDAAAKKIVKELDKRAKHLHAHGWAKELALKALRFEHGWTRVHWHASQARNLIREAFVKTLLAGPVRKLTSRAAVLPSDLLVLLMPEVLHMPVLGEKDAMAMYNQYVTELEFDIRVGNPKPETFDKLRSLKYELNAISQLQCRQLTVLDSLFHNSMSNKVGDDDSDHGTVIIGSDVHIDDPHPRLNILTATRDTLRIENEHILDLNDLVDLLQGEGVPRHWSAPTWPPHFIVMLVASVMSPLLTFWLFCA